VQAASGVPSTTFESAVDGVVAGEVDTLGRLLDAEPDLIRARSTRAHRATLLHYVGANGVEDERQRTPPNAVEIAELLLSSGAEVNAVASMYAEDTTFELVATSIHPAKAGVLVPLLEALLDAGAAIDGVAGRSLISSALANGRPQAADFLAQRGARVDLEGASGLGLVEQVESHFDRDGALKLSATRAQLEAGFMWACEYGRTAVAELLLDRGVDVRIEVGGMTGLHWAVNNWQPETIRLLLERGAQLEQRNGYGGTALGQALWSVFNSDPVWRWPLNDADCEPVLELLLTAGADVSAVDFPTGNECVDGLLRAHGATEHRR
jgi:ankyrin repeat protein